MNKYVLDSFMHSPPAKAEEKYIFLVDSVDLGVNIMGCGYRAVSIVDKAREGFYTVDEFLAYLQTLENQGSDRSEYTFVLTMAKWKNAKVEEYLTKEYLHFRNSWTLFHKKEYLENVKYLDELRQMLSSYVARLEGPGIVANGPDLGQFHTYTAKGIPNGVMDSEVITYIMNNHPLIVLNGVPFLYEHGVYRRDLLGSRTRAIIAGLVYSEFKKAPILHRIYDLLIDQVCLQYGNDDVNRQPKPWVNFQNGYYDPLTGEMKEHDREYLTLNQIPFAYYPDEDISKCGGVVKAFLDSSLPDPTEQETFWEYLGYCMTADTRFQKFMMIKGPGGTGKSVLISMVEMVVGKENSVNISIQDLNKRFYATSLYGMLLNACADIPSSSMQSVDILKKAVGEDPVMYEKKGQDPQKFNSYAKLLFSANEMPLNLDDKTNAYYRRLLVLDMNNIVPAGEIDLDLKSRLAKETNYMIHMAMAALGRLYERGSFIESAHSKECIDELYRSADSIKAFLDECVVIKKDAKTKRSAIYEAYADYCKENDRQAHGKAIFFRSMANRGFNLRKMNSGIYYADLELIDDSEFLEVDPGESTPFDGGEHE